MAHPIEGIASDRRQLILELANGEWVDRLPRDLPEDKFDEMLKQKQKEALDLAQTGSDPRELFMFVECWNWDDGVEPLALIVDNPACDLGTALLIYWRAEAPYFTKSADRSEVSKWARDSWDLVQKVQAKVLAGRFTQSEMPFDPASEGWNRPCEEPGAKWTIPDDMYGPWWNTGVAWKV